MVRGFDLLLLPSVLFYFEYLDLVEHLALVESLEESYLSSLPNYNYFSIFIGVLALAGASSAFSLQVESLP